MSKSQPFTRRVRPLLHSVRDAARSSIWALAALVIVLTIGMFGTARAQLTPPAGTPAVQSAPSEASTAVKENPPRTASNDGDPLPALDAARVQIAFESVFLYMVPLTLGVVGLILGLYFGKPGATAAFLPYFGEGQVMQFVVIIAIAGNIWSLAIAGVVGRTEVAAIYGGIVGYVLGKKSEQWPARPIEPRRDPQDDADQT